MQVRCEGPSFELEIWIVPQQQHRRLNGDLECTRVFYKKISSLQESVHRSRGRFRKYAGRCPGYLWMGPKPPVVEALKPGQNILPACFLLASSSAPAAEAYSADCQHHPQDTGIRMTCLCKKEHESKLLETRISIAGLNVSLQPSWAFTPSACLPRAGFFSYEPVFQNPSRISFLN